MKKAIPWLETEDFAPDSTEEPADSQADDEDEYSFWDNMIFPI